MKSDPRVRALRPTVAVLGEGVLWHPRRGSLLWVDIVDKKIFETRVDGTSDEVRVLNVDQMIGALVPDAARGAVAAMHHGVYSIDLDTGIAVERSLPAEHDTQRLRFNDAKCDPRGRLWLGTLSLTGEKAAGSLYRYDSRGGWARMLSGVGISNGLAWSADGRTLYYIDSPTRAVQAFAYDPDTGTIGPSRLAFDVSRIPGVPDGCTIDTAGCLWIAHWGGSCVSRWDPVSGRLLETLAIPASQVTNCTFGGEGLKTLFVTTASIGLSESDRAEQPLAGQTFFAEVGAHGCEAVAFR